MILIAIRFRRKKEGKEEAGILIESIGADNRILDRYGKEVKVVYDYTRLNFDLILDLSPILKEIKSRLNRLNNETTGV